MGQPTPPGDLPLFEGLDPSWNDIVSAFPEDRRAELAPKLKERIDSYEPLKQWESLQKSGITPEHANTALNVFRAVENNPREVYEAIGNHLGITPAQAKAVVEEIQEEEGDDPRITALKNQVDTLTQIQLAQRQHDNQAQLAKEQDELLESEISGIKKKYGNDVPEDEIVMRMLHKNMTAEEAYQEYSGRVNDIRSRRPSPMVMGSGGAIPPRSVDPTKLNTTDTKSLVKQYLDHANQEARK